MADNTTTPTISVSAPGTVQEASVGAGVTVPLTVTTTNLSGDIYYEVLTSSGTVETAYTAALPTGAAITVPTVIPQQKAGQTFFVQVAFNYVPIRANLMYSSTSGGVTFSSFASNSGITWDATGQIATIPISNGTASPHYFQIEDTTTASPLKSATVVYQIGSSGGGGTVTVAPPTPVGTTQNFTIQAHLAHSGDVVKVVNNPTSSTVTATSSPVTITDPVVTTPTISVSAPGTVQEASPGAGVTVTETVTTTNLTGNVYEEVITAAGTVETPYQAVPLVNGTATFTVHLAASGDKIRVVDNPTTPTVTANSLPVTITDPVTATPSISVSAPGTVQEASVGAGVTVPLTVTTTNLSGDIYYEVLTSSGAVETAYAAALPTGAAITVPTVIPQQKTGQTFFVQVAFNYVPIRANLMYSSTSGGVTFSSFASNSGITWDATGQIATIPISNGTAAPHYFQIEDTTTSSPLKSATVVYQLGSSGGGGTVTVAPPTPVGTTQNFTIQAHLAHSGDVVKVVNNPASSTVTATSSPVTITDPVVTTPTISVSAPGTVQEASPGAGVTVTETVTTTNLTGSVYEEVITAAGTVETPFQAVALVNGTAKFTVHLAASGDKIRVVDNATTPTVTANSLPVTITDLAATALALDTPAQATPNTVFTVTGTYQGSPQSLDYNFGAGWIQASSVTFSGGTFSFTVPAGLAAGSYTPQIRDHYAPSVTSSAGTFVVNSWTPETLTTSPGAVAVFEFNANDPTIAAVQNGTVHSVENSLNETQSLTAEVASGGNGILIANRSGADGTRRLLQFHPSTISAALYDPATNWLGAGGVNGSAGAALVNLANSPNVSTTGSFTTIIALDISKSYGYAAGPIWGSLASPGPLEYAQIRYNGSNGQAGGQVFDSSATTPLVGASAQGTISAGWHVMTMIKSGGTITYRLDGQTVATAQVNFALPFTANDFMIGGGFPPASSVDAGRENGVPPPYIGEFQAYSGVLAGTDLASAEKLAGNAIGLSLNPTVPASNIVVSAATIQQQSQTPQSASFIASPTSTSTADTVTVNQPTSLAAAMQTITGTESDPSQSIFLDWDVSGTPALSDTGWVQANVTKTGQFSAALNIDHPGVQGTMFYRIGSGSAVAAWSATPHSQVA